MPVADAGQRGVRRSFCAVGDFHLPPPCLKSPSNSPHGNSADTRQYYDRLTATHSYAQPISPADLHLNLNKHSQPFSNTSANLNPDA